VSIGPRSRLVLLGTAIATGSLLASLLIAHSPERVRHEVDGFGIAAPAAFVALSAALSCAFFSGPLLAGAAGLVFGTAGGTAVAIAAATAAASLAFTISRRGGAGAVRELAGERVHRRMDWVEGRGFVGVLYLRLLPAMPFTVINYAAGLTHLPLRTFAAATLIGVAPRAYAYATLGGHLRDLDSPQAIVAISLLVAMGLAGVALALRERRRSRSRTSA